MWLTRRHLLASGVAAALGTTGAGAAPRRPSGRIALGGYDAVSYFLDGPAPGQAAYETDWLGDTWRFARAANRDAFRHDPASYAPRLGGFDPIGVLAGRLVDTDPLVFALCPDPVGAPRLYLLRNALQRTQFLTDPTLAERAEARWPALRDQIERDFPD